MIEAALATMPANPGVYRMLDAKGDALYVGKARSLKKRVTSYTQIARLPERLRRMVSETVSMEIVTTHTEAEALLLEANLIKRLKPRFNIVLRDDKILSVADADRGSSLPADRQASRRATAQGQLLRAVRLRLGGQPDRDRDAAGVPAALLPGHGVRQPHPAVPAATRSAAARRPASAASARRSTAGWSARRRRSWPARVPPCSRSWPPRWSTPPRRWSSSAPPRCATASAG